MANLKEYTLELSSISAAAYQSATETLISALDCDSSRWIAGFAERGTLSNTANLKMSIDHSVKGYSGTGQAVDWKRAVTFTTATTSDGSETIFPSTSLVQLLPYSRIVATLENTGASLASFQNVVIKLLTGKL